MATARNSAPSPASEVVPILQKFLRIAYDMRLNGLQERQLALMLRLEKPVSAALNNLGAKYVEPAMRERIRRERRGVFEEDL